MSSYGAHAVIPSNKNSFHELLRRTRQEADQTEEVMGVVLNMSAEEYRDLETWRYPDEDTLKRLCLMMEWNYYDTQRLIINEMISPRRPAPAGAGDQDAPHNDPAAQSRTARGGPPAPAAGRNGLGERLREVRMITGQSMDIISLMLNIDEEEYKRLEEGMQPSDELLRRISMVYNWNYQDLISVLRSEHAKNFQPSRVGMPFLGSTAQSARLRQVIGEMEGLFVKLSDADQQMILGQLELIRDSIRRQQKVS